MKVISRLTCPDEINDCDYALINLTPDLARLALRRITRLKGHQAKDGDLWEAYYWDHHAEYFSPWLAGNSGEADALVETIERFPAASMDLMRAHDDFSVPEGLLGSVECCQLVIRDEGIAFAAMPKHTDAYIKTAEIPLRLLEEAAAAGVSGG